MKIYCNEDAKSLFSASFLTSSIEDADLSVILQNRGKAPGGILIQAYQGQAYYRNGDYLQFHLSNSLRGNVLGETKPPFFDIAIYNDNDKDAFTSKMMQEVVLQLARYRFFNLDSLLLHASVVVSKHSGIGFIGPSGAGKSTQSKLWVKHRDAYILNDDKPLIHFDNEKVLVSGTPWSGKGNYYLNETHELKALCIVKQSCTNEIHRLSEAQAYSYIYLNNLPVVVNREIEKCYERLVSQLCKKIPIYLLNCLPDEGAVIVTENEIFGRRMTKMQIKPGFVLREIAGEWLVIAKGKNALQFNSTIVLNETSAFLWNTMSAGAYSEEDLLRALLEEYDVDAGQARNDIQVFLAKMHEYGVLEQL